MTDIEIARKSKLQHITKIAEKLGIAEKDLELFGNYKAKVSSKPRTKKK